MAKGTTFESQARRQIYPPTALAVYGHNPATPFPNSRPNRHRQWLWDANHKTTHSKGWAMTEQKDRLARARAEIAKHVASFKATQEKFEREREEFFIATLENARNGSNNKALWS
jgi:hypothetical protein